MLTPAPRVTVLMPVRDGGRFLEPAVESILAQTLEDLELLVVDDGSTDGTPEVLSRVHDPRLRVLRRPAEGMAAALNVGLRSTQSPYVARMDADDLCEPTRLERQVAFLDRHPEVVVVGSRYRSMDVDGRPGRVTALMVHDVDLRRDLHLGYSPFAHGAVTMRRDRVLAVGGYDGTWWPAEDHDLWRRLDGRFANLPDVLYHYREHSSTSSLTSQAARGSELTELVRAAGPPPRRTPLEVAQGWWTHRHERELYARRQRALRVVRRERRQRGQTGSE